MRIGLFHWTLPQPGRKPGGVDIAVHQLANALTRAGEDDVTVFSFSPKPADAKYNHRLLLKSRLWSSNNKFLRLYILPAILNVLGLYKDIDVLHLHGNDWLFLRRGNLPTVRTFHGSALHEARTATSWKRHISQRVIYKLEKVAALLATVTVGVGPETVQLYDADHLVNNGVDTNRFRPGPKAELPRVLFVGTWAGRKRGAFLYEQFINVIRKAVPNAELYMVSDECRSGPGVVHVVTPDEHTLAELYSSAWVFAYPSLYEGFGITYLEAMASGTAIVATPNAGAEHVLESGRLAYLVDDRSFGQSVVSLLTNPMERRRLENEGCRAAQRFTWDRAADVHRDIYRSAIERSSLHKVAL